MSNTENKNEQIKNLKEIDAFLSGKVKPLLSKIADARSLATRSNAMIRSILQERSERENELLAQELQQQEQAAATQAQPVVETPVAQEEPVSADQPQESVAQAETQPVAEVETKQEEASAEPVAPTQTVKPSKPAEKPQDKPRTYINPEMVRQQNRNNNNGTYPQRRDGARPPVSNRPNNAGPRPNGNFSRPAPVAPPPVSTQRDAAKKKKSPGFTKDDSRNKSLSKRDLLKKGYQVDSTLMNDSDTARYVKAKKTKKDNFTPQRIVIEHAVLTSENTPIKVFSEKIGKTATEIIKKLFDMGIAATINDSITFEQAELVAIEYDITLELKLDATAEDKLAALVQDTKVDTANMVKRPPIVTIMGHVDHGKTSLLDYIRKTNVVMSEAGGITQHIGAYTIDLNGERITFLDTPGHEAFTSMRQRGAQVTDIAIIVIAADDGVMPQTVEAINHAKDAGVSIIVAVNKIDKVSDTEEAMNRIKNQISQYGLTPEDWGGDVMLCPVSAKKGLGVKELLENVLLVAEVLELKANKKCPASGSIIEARLDKGAGPIATVLVQNGTLRIKDYVVAGTAIGKIRAMTDYTGKRVKEAGPSYAVQVQGFTEVPNAGDLMVVVADEKLAKKVAQERADKERSEMQMRSNARTLDDMFKNVSADEVKTLTILIKADVQGSVEAVRQSLMKLSDEMEKDNVKIHVVHSGVGAVNESDIMLADTAHATVIAFNVRPEPKAKLLAERNGIEIRNYRIIYDAIEDIKKALKGMLEPTFRENVLGHAEVRDTFRISSVGTIAGCYITDGKVMRNASVRLLRDNIVIYEGKLASLRREKDDVKEVASGYECGIGLEKWNDIKVGDVIECFVMEKVENE